MNTTGIFRLHEIKREGVTRESNIPYVHVTAFDFYAQEDKNEAFIMIHAFGSTAEYIKRNLTKSRRAFIVGNLDLHRYIEEVPVTKIIKVDGKKVKVTFNVDQERSNLCIVANQVRFLDTREDEEVEGETLEADDDGIEVAEVIEDGEDTDTSGETMTITPANTAATTAEESNHKFKPYNRRSRRR